MNKDLDYNLLKLIDVIEFKNSVSRMLFRHFAQHDVKLPLDVAQYMNFLLEKENELLSITEKVAKDNNIEFNTGYPNGFTNELIVKDKQLIQEWKEKNGITN